MNSTPSQKSTNKDNHQISRRSFIGTTAAGGAALLTGGLASPFRRQRKRQDEFSVRRNEYHAIAGGDGGRATERKGSGPEVI